MLRDSDNSMMTIPSATTVSDEVAVQSIARTPVSRASEVEETGSDWESGSRSAVAVDSSQIFSAHEWARLESGLKQRFEAVSACLQELSSGKTVPGFLRESPELAVAVQKVLAPIAGISRTDIFWGWFGTTDLSFDADGQILVLDHDFSLPTGLERLVSGSESGDLTDRISSQLFGRDSALDRRRGETVVLDPGFYSASFQANEFLARCLKGHLARQSDLTVRADGVFLKIGGSLRQVRTVVRRVDDDLLDPNCFRPDSLVGLPGLVRAWKAGLVNVVNPPCTGLVRLRSFGRLIPRMIQTYLNQEPLLQSIDVLECTDTETLRMIVARPEKFAIRTNDPLHPARPFFGRTGTMIEFSDLLTRIRRNPFGWVARPLLPESSARMNVRTFASLSGSFRLLRAGLVRDAQPDGGASLAIGSDTPVRVCW
jgi:uncharacterized circularly permuted ATP-grasp superfamily protein